MFNRLSYLGAFSFYKKIRFRKHSSKVLGFLKHIAGLPDPDSHGRQLTRNIEPQPKYAENEVIQVSPAFERGNNGLSLNRDNF